MQVSLQSMIMDIGPSEPGSPASMSFDYPSAAPSLSSAAAFLNGSSVSSTEQPPQVCHLCRVCCCACWLVTGIHSGRAVNCM